MDKPKKTQTDSMYGKCVVGKQMVMTKHIITLIGIDFDKSAIEKPSLEDEIKKCKEEDKEFIQAVIKGDIQNALEEYHDKIMSSTNTLIMMGIPLGIIARSQIEHFNKLVNRGVVFKE